MDRALQFVADMMMHHTRRWVLGMMLLVVGTTSGCVADVDGEEDDDFEEDVVQASSALDGPLPILVRVKQGKGGRSITRTYRYKYPRELQNYCGPDFSITLTARLGKVTADTVKVNSVKAVFLPARGETIVPTFLEAYSNATQLPRIVDYDAFQKGFSYGQSHVWDVNRAIKSTKSGPATLTLPVGGLRGGELLDAVCTFNPTLQLLPR